MKTAVPRASRPMAGFVPSARVVPVSPDGARVASLGAADREPLGYGSAAGFVLPDPTMGLASYWRRTETVVGPDVFVAFGRDARVMGCGGATVGDGTGAEVARLAQPGAAGAGRETKLAAVSAREARDGVPLEPDASPTMPGGRGARAGVWNARANGRGAMLGAWNAPAGGRGAMAGGWGARAGGWGARAGGWGVRAGAWGARAGAWDARAGGRGAMAGAWNAPAGGRDAMAGGWGARAGAWDARAGGRDAVSGGTTVATRDARDPATMAWRSGAPIDGERVVGTDLSNPSVGAIAVAVGGADAGHGKPAGAPAGADAMPDRSNEKEAADRVACMADDDCAFGRVLRREGAAPDALVEGRGVRGALTVAGKGSTRGFDGFAAEGDGDEATVEANLPANVGTGGCVAGDRGAYAATRSLLRFVSRNAASPRIIRARACRVGRSAPVFARACSIVARCCSTAAVGSDVPSAADWVAGTIDLALKRCTLAVRSLNASAGRDREGMAGTDACGGPGGEAALAPKLRSLATVVRRSVAIPRSRVLALPPAERCVGLPPCDVASDRASVSRSLRAEPPPRVRSRARARAGGAAAASPEAFAKSAARWYERGIAPPPPVFA